MGITLITLGIVMLISQIYGISVIEHIIKWWPVVLIIIGIEILVYIFLSKQEEPKVKFDIFSIIIISMLMIASIGAYTLTSFITFSDGDISFSPVFSKYNYNSTFRKSLSLDANSSNLIVNNSNGDVEVVKGEGKKIEVEANITINNNDEAYAADVADMLIDVVNEKSTHISSKAQKNFDRSKIGSIVINYLIKVPDTVNVEVDNKFGDVVLKGIALSGIVHNGNGGVTAENIGGTLIVDNEFGDVSARDVKGKAEIYSKNGKVIAHSIANSLKVESVFGNIELNDIKGFAEISNTNGEIRGVRLGGDLTVISKFGDVIFSEISGNVDIDQENGYVDVSGINKAVKVSNKFGDIKIKNAIKSITLNASNGSITLETDKIIEQNVIIENKFGDILLKLPDTQNGQFDAHTNLGSIENEFGFNVNKDVTKETMNGTLVNDKVRFKLSNDNGDISVEKIK